MGGDHGCGVVIEGAKRALQADRRITALYLVGNRSEIHAALAPARVSATTACASSMPARC